MDPKKKYICGIDEAGRGPVIGPLVMGGVIIDQDLLPKLEEQGVKDSKQIPPKKREDLSKIIKNNCVKFKIIEITAKTIDSKKINENINLNMVELEAIVNILNDIKPKIAYIDCPDIKPDRFKSRILKRIKYQPKPDIIVEHKADENYVVVGAASILAKVRRDKIIQELNELHQDKIGTGYPSDPKTRSFLENFYKKHKYFPDFVRTTWDTCKKIRQVKLDDFFK